MVSGLRHRPDRRASRRYHHWSGTGIQQSGLGEGSRLRNRAGRLSLGIIGNRESPRGGRGIGRIGVNARQPYQPGSLRRGASDVEGQTRVPRIRTAHRRMRGHVGRTSPGTLGCPVPTSHGLHVGQGAQRGDRAVAVHAAQCPPGGAGRRVSLPPRRGSAPGRRSREHRQGDPGKKGFSWTWTTTHA